MTRKSFPTMQYQWRTLMENNQFPNHEGKIDALKRCLHILSLTQHIPANNETWNSASLSSLLSLDEVKDSGVDDSSVTKYINHQIKNGFGIEIDTVTVDGKSARVVSEDIDIDAQLNFARVYSAFVIEDTSRNIALKKFIKAMPDRALWTIARVYFAVLEKRMIQIDYTGSSGNEIQNWKLYPYYFFFSEFNLYLTAYDPVENLRFTLRAERIRNLIVTDESFKKHPDITPVSKLYRNSLSAYLSIDGPVKMKIRYKKTAAANIEDLISPLNPVKIPHENGEQFEAEFIIDDYRFLCKQLFMYGKNVEIISPPEVRQTMVTMLKESLGVYEG